MIEMINYFIYFFLSYNSIKFKISRKTTQYRYYLNHLLTIYEENLQNKKNKILIFIDNHFNVYINKI